ncbi:HPr family phosphocarrier protein [Leptotrichia hongkongensis]|jgi:phosphocarrier,  HPr family|uniref:HPr family phosphocarrier protein n=1 Tax=Leptotrichia hongkongensis TaxID=554406 RepID=UPI0035A91386
MITRTLEVKNRTGLHARPISQIIKVISKYKSKTLFRVGDNKVENKSVLGFLKLGAKFGTKVEIEIDGEDETELLKELESLFYSNFGE